MPIGTGKFVSNSFFVYPVAMIYLGFFVPVIIDFTRNKEADYNTLFLVALLYSLSFLLTQVPLWFTG